MLHERIGLSIASMVLGIISVSFSAISIAFLFFVFSLGLALVIIALICGIIAIILGHKSRPLSRGIAGLVLGIIGTSLAGSIIVIANLLYIVI